MIRELLPVVLAVGMILWIAIVTWIYWNQRNLGD